MRKFGIIGLGNVGRTVAYTLVTKGIADSLVLIDKDQKKSRAEQLDLQDAQARLNTTTQITTQNYDNLKDVDILYISAGDIAVSTNSGDRFAEFKITSAVVKEIAPKIVASGFKGVIIDIMNPCDAVTSYLQKLTGFSKQRVFGTGTFLDTARMQRVVGEKLNVNPRSVEGYVLGEHGNSQFVAWSSVRVKGEAIQDLPEAKDFVFDQLADAAKQGAWEVASGKGFTSAAIATCGVSLGQAVLSDARLVCPVSGYSEKYSTYVGLPAIVGKNGIESVVDLPLTDEETVKFAKSAEMIHDRVAKLN